MSEPVKLENVIGGVMAKIKDSLNPAPCSVCGAPCSILCDWDGYKPTCSENYIHIKYIVGKNWADAVMKWNGEVMNSGSGEATT